MYQCHHTRTSRQHVQIRITDPRIVSKTLTGQMVERELEIHLSANNELERSGDLRLLLGLGLQAHVVSGVSTPQNYPRPEHGLRDYQTSLSNATVFWLS